MLGPLKLHLFLLRTVSWLRFYWYVHYTKVWSVCNDFIFYNMYIYPLIFSVSSSQVSFISLHETFSIFNRMYNVQDITEELLKDSYYLYFHVFVLHPGFSSTQQSCTIIDLKNSVDLQANSLFSPPLTSISFCWFWVRDALCDITEGGFPVQCFLAHIFGKIEQAKEVKIGLALFLGVQVRGTCYCLRTLVLFFMI